MSCLPRRAFQREKVECPSGSEEDVRDFKSRRRVLDMRRGSPSQQSNNSLSNCSELKDMLNSASLGGSSKLRRTSSGTLAGLLTPSAKKTSDSDRETISQKQIEVYGQVFEDIIRQDTVYGGLLQSVKKNYDDFIAQLTQVNSDLQERVSAPTSNTHQEVLKEFQKLREEINLKDNCIQNLLKEKEAIDQQIKAEKENARITISKLNSECKSARTRESKYLRHVTTLREKGYPVEEVYKKCVRKKPTPSASVHKISIPHSPSGLKPEFVAHFEEFSESWKERIQKQNKFADNL